jgi:hypothetical protein
MCDVADRNNKDFAVKSFDGGSCVISDRQNPPSGFALFYHHNNNIESAAFVYLPLLYRYIYLRISSIGHPPFVVLID